ncbi:DUF6230 family protein [Streptomyces incanus]|uniref:DUF6230 family protein n=1 Tax=Streptomyces incanus TaxID=887453 RepID=A0ABW0XUM7_9ACTN
MFAPCALAAGALGIALAQGAIAASFAVSGTAFKVHAEEVTTDGLPSFPSSIGYGGGAKPVPPVAVKDGAISGVCVSLKQKVPAVGEISVPVRSGSDKPLKGGNPIANADALIGGGGKVTGVQAGRDASTLSRNPRQASSSGVR